MCVCVDSALGRHHAPLHKGSCKVVLHNLLLSEQFGEWSSGSSATEGNRIGCGGSCEVRRGLTMNILPVTLDLVTAGTCVYRGTTDRQRLHQRTPLNVVHNLGVEKTV